MTTAASLLTGEPAGPGQDDLLTRLQDQARNRPQRSWDDYAHETWTYLTT